MELSAGFRRAVPADLEALGLAALVLGTVLVVVAMAHGDRLDVPRRHRGQCARPGGRRRHRHRHPLHRLLRPGQDGRRLADRQQGILRAFARLTFTRLIRGPSELQGHLRLGDGLTAPAVLAVVRRSQGVGGQRTTGVLVLDLQVYAKASLVTAMLDSPRKIGFDRARARELNWLVTNERIAAGPLRHTCEQYLEFAWRLAGSYAIMRKGAIVALAAVAAPARPPGGECRSWCHSTALLPGQPEGVGIDRLVG